MCMWKRWQRHTSLDDHQKIFFQILTITKCWNFSVFESGGKSRDRLHIQLILQCRFWSSRSLRSLMRDRCWVRINPSSSCSSVDAWSRRNRIRQTSTFNPTASGPWPDHTSTHRNLHLIRRRANPAVMSQTHALVTHPDISPRKCPLSEIFSYLPLL